jgi:hypothetical protein
MGRDMAAIDKNKLYPYDTFGWSEFAQIGGLYGKKVFSPFIIFPSILRNGFSPGILS